MASLLICQFWINLTGMEYGFSGDYWVHTYMKSLVISLYLSNLSKLCSHKTCQKLLQNTKSFQRFLNHQFIPWHTVTTALLSKCMELKRNEE